MPIRWRLTLWYSLILCIVLAISGTVLHILLQSYLNNEVDDNLRINSARVNGVFSGEKIPDSQVYEAIQTNLPQINEFALTGVYIEIRDRSGKVVMKSDNLGEQELPVDRNLLSQGFDGLTAIADVSAGGGSRVRIMVSPLYLGEQFLVLEVGHSLNYVDVTMTRVRWAILASVLLALALATVSGSAMVKQALSPVRRVTTTARDIEAGSDLSRRVDYEGPRDEIGDLATTFDHMLEHLERLFRSQKNFVADASHELRGPLTVIRGNLDLLKKDMSEAERRESREAIGRESLRMAKIVDDLLLLAEVESGESARHQAVSLKGVLLEEVERARTLAGNRKITIDKQQDLSVEGDVQRLKQLLANLISNAIRYTPETGTITLSLYRDGQWARLEVADTGIGIAQKHLPHIFDRFYRVDRVRSRGDSGTGLGLAIVKGIAEQHGGRVAVTSEPSKGSIFTVWLKL